MERIFNNRRGSDHRKDSWKADDSNRRLGKKLVKNFYEKYRVSADTLERLIERDEKKHLSHYRIHKILLELGYAKQKEKRDVCKKKWKRYE